jgi:hypothetical protein
VSNPSIDLVRALVDRHAAVLSEADRHLIDRHLAEVERLLMIVVGIVRRAAQHTGRGKA